MAVFLRSEALMLLVPCDRSTASVRLSFPSVYAVGTVKHVMLNQPFSLDWAGPSSLGLQPGTTFARRPRPNPATLGVAVKASGKPSWKVAAPLTLQPEL